MSIWLVLIFLKYKAEIGFQGVDSTTDFLAGGNSNDNYLTSKS